VGGRVPRRKGVGCGSSTEQWLEPAQRRDRLKKKSTKGANHKRQEEKREKLEREQRARKGGPFRLPKKERFLIETRECGGGS